MRKHSKKKLQEASKKCVLDKLNYNATRFPKTNKAFFCKIIIAN